MKAAQIRMWWENHVHTSIPSPGEDLQLCAPYSLLMQSDALWALAGTEVSCKVSKIRVLTLSFVVGPYQSVYCTP